MGIISLQTPVIGNPNTTEGPKIVSDFTAVQNLVNGNLDTNNISPTAALADAQFASPNTGYRKLLFSNAGPLIPGFTYTVGGEDFIVPSLGNPIPSLGSTTTPVPIFAGDSGLGGQPPDFQVTGKTAKGRLRCVFTVGSTAPGVVIFAQLYLLAGIGGSGTIQYNFTPVSGTATNSLNLSAGANSGCFAAESPEFALPMSANYYTIGVNLSSGSGTTAAGAFVTMTLGLYGYNT